MHIAAGIELQTIKILKASILMIKTKEDYIRSLRQPKLDVFSSGKHVYDMTAHLALIPRINTADKTYELTLIPE